MSRLAQACRAIGERRDRGLRVREWIDDLVRDVRFGARQLLGVPAFTVMALLTIALGIGANTAIFSAVYGVLLRPLPYREAGRLVVTHISLPDAEDVARETGLFDRTAVWATNLYNLAHGSETEQIRGAVVSGDFFPILGVDARLGRTLAPGDRRTAVAVISTRLWKERLGADTAAIGRTLDLGGDAYTIVGIMPPEFQVPSAGMDVWVPLEQALDAAPSQRRNRALRIFRLLGRLPADGTIAQAQDRLSALASRLAASYPDTNAPGVFTLMSLQQRIVGDVARQLVVLQCAVALLLLIACANVANLLLARTTARGREVAIRMALGAGRGRVARQLLVESLMLALAGGAIGSLLAVWAVKAVPALVGDRLPRATDIALDMPVLAFALAASIVTGLLFGLTPILQLAWRGEGASLKDGTRGVVGTAPSRRVRAALVAAEIALSLIVLIGAGLLVRSFVHLLATEVGFPTERLLTFNVQLVKLPTTEERARAALALVDRLRELPGATAAGAATGLAPVIAQRGTRFAVEGDTGPDLPAYWIAATPTYFHALGARLAEGRSFEDRDTTTAPKVVIINETLARRLFPDGPAVGKRLRLVNPDQSPDWRTIVGVSGDVKYGGLDAAGDATVYTPFQQTPFLWVYVVMRTQSPNPLTMAGAARAQVATVDPRLVAAAFQSAEDLISDAVAQPRFVMLFASTFAAIALALAAIGIYGVVSYGVAQRTGEIALRMALGARGGDIMGLFLREGAVLAAAGVLLGLGGAYPATRAMSTLLFEVTPTDPVTFAGLSAALVIVTLAACSVPAWRATRSQPMRALAGE